MNVLIAVIEDLSQFAIGAIAKLFGKSGPSRTLIASPSQNVLSARNQILIKDVSTDEPSEFRSLKSVVEKRAEIPRPERTKTNLAPKEQVQNKVPGSTMIVGSTDAVLFINPTREFDAVLRTVPYGALVALTREQGAWAEVTYDGVTGWISRDHLVSHQGIVRPFFVIKEYCSPEAEATVRLRRMIGDEFAGAVAELPLHAEEYVYYQLLVRGIVLPRLSKRPRQAGTWHKLLSGEHGVHVGIRPKTGSVMEYENEEGEGQLAYIEAVFPDESISLSEVGNPKLGFYNERMLGKEVWQHLKPVFISFS